MAIGVFDSGVGGLTVHRALVRRFPGADLIYLADQSNAPYGGRPGEQIVELTRAGCERLFAEGCDLVVLACNTASSIALRRLQQTWLPGHRRELGRPINALGIIVPTIEAATGLPWANLARMIEAGADADALRVEVAGHVAALGKRIGRQPDRAILGCTHYEIIAELFREALPPGTPLIHQPDSTADAIDTYLTRHPEYRAGTEGVRRFLTTGEPGLQNGLVATFWGAPLRFEAV